jgi:hypothetical protein
MPGMCAMSKCWRGRTSTTSASVLPLSAVRKACGLKRCASGSRCSCGGAASLGCAPVNAA